MSRKIDKGRDPYAFSLRGVSTIASFVAPTAIAIDRLNRARDEQSAETADGAPDADEQSSVADKPVFGRFWLRIARRWS